MKRFNLLLIVLIFTTLLLGTSANALDFDFSGTFTYDNDVLLLNFTVGQDSTITIFSSSWDDGGFDPILAIWNSSGILVSEQDDGENIGSTLSNGVDYDYGLWDSYFDVVLTAGDYTASITQFDNFAKNDSLSAGFEYDDNPNFTYDEGYGTQPYFNGLLNDNDTRTGNWAFHILNVAEANESDPVVPVPSTMVLLGTGLLGLIAASLKRFKK